MTFRLVFQISFKTVFDPSSRKSMAEYTKHNFDMKYMTILLSTASIFEPKTQYKIIFGLFFSSISERGASWLGVCTQYMVYLTACNACMFVGVN